MRSTATAWAAWWVVLAALYLLLADNVATPELVTGAALAALGATGAVLVRRDRLLLLRPRARWLRDAWRPLLGLGGDLVPLARGLVRRGGASRYVEVPLDPSVLGDDPRAAAYRAWTEVLGSMAPNTVIVEVDPVRGVALAHQLEGRDPAAPRVLPIEP
jgi:hypothetical protein